MSSSIEERMEWVIKRLRPETGLKDKYGSPQPLEARMAYYLPRGYQ